MNKDGGGSLDLLNIRSMAKVSFLLFQRIDSRRFRLSCF